MPVFVKMGRKVTSLLALCALSCFVRFCAGACTIDAITGLQTAAFDNAKLDGHWYVTHMFGNESNTDKSYTVDVVPTTAGFTLYLNRNTTGTACQYVGIALESTTTPKRFVTTASAPGTAQTIVFAALEAEGNFALMYVCTGHVVNKQACTDAQALVMGRQRTSKTAAATWLQSLSSPPCFETISPVVVLQLSTECPFKPIWGLPGQDCTVGSFPVQQNFDLSKYLGVWWEMSWLAPFYIPASELFLDYYHNYTMQADGNVTINIVGRSPEDGKCFFYHVNLLMTGAPGRMIFNESAGPMPYNVAFVDYDNYAVVYGCSNFSQSTGECLVARSWLWSRQITLDRQYLLAANTMLQRLCFNPAAFLPTPQTNDCNKDTGGGNALASSVFVTSVLILLTQII